MRKSTKLILAVAMLCFAIMAVNSNCVFADEQHDLIEKKVKQTNRIVKGSGNTPKLMYGRYQIKQTSSTTFPVVISQPGR
jgi:hypothetical protein